MAILFQHVVKSICSWVWLSLWIWRLITFIFLLWPKLGFNKPGWLCSILRLLKSFFSLNFMRKTQTSSRRVRLINKKILESERSEEADWRLNYSNHGGGVLSLLMVWIIILFDQRWSNSCSRSVDSRGSLHECSSVCRPQTKVKAEQQLISSSTPPSLTSWNLQPDFETSRLPLSNPSTQGCFKQQPGEPVKVGLGHWRDSPQLKVLAAILAKPWTHLSLNERGRDQTQALI